MEHDVYLAKIAEMVTQANRPEVTNRYQSYFVKNMQYNRKLEDNTPELLNAVHKITKDNLSASNCQVSFNGFQFMEKAVIIREKTLQRYEDPVARGIEEMQIADTRLMLAELADEICLKQRGSALGSYARNYKQRQEQGNNR